MFVYLRETQGKLKPLLLSPYRSSSSSRSSTHILVLGFWFKIMYSPKHPLREVLKKNKKKLDPVSNLLSQKVKKKSNFLYFWNRILVPNLTTTIAPHMEWHSHTSVWMASPDGLPGQPFCCIMQPLTTVMDKPFLYAMQPLMTQSQGHKFD